MDDEVALFRESRVRLESRSEKLAPIRTIGDFDFMCEIVLKMILMDSTSVPDSKAG